MDEEEMNKQVDKGRSMSSYIDYEKIQRDFDKEYKEKRPKVKSNFVGCDSFYRMN